MLKLSVIIPIYNAEKYIQRCLDSVIDQGLDDIEIICVDDGSTDNSFNILEKYEKENKNIFVYTQKNSYAGTARNFAYQKQKVNTYIFWMQMIIYCRKLITCLSSTLKRYRQILLHLGLARMMRLA